jgi:cold shock CspA family protein
MPGGGPISGSGPISGTVSAFDNHRGLGTITDRRGREWPFHCTAIADGSRTIEVGTAVVFCPVAGPLGQMEAAGVQSLGSLAQG